MVNTFKIDAGILAAAFNGNVVACDLCSGVFREDMMNYAPARPLESDASKDVELGPELFQSTRAFTDLVLFEVLVRMAKDLELHKSKLTVQSWLDAQLWGLLTPRVRFLINTRYISLGSAKTDVMHLLKIIARSAYNKDNVLKDTVPDRWYFPAIETIFSDGFASGRRPVEATDIQCILSNALPFYVDAYKTTHKSESKVLMGRWPHRKWVSVPDEINWSLGITRIARYCEELVKRYYDDLTPLRTTHILGETDGYWDYNHKDNYIQKYVKSHINKFIIGGSQLTGYNKD